MVRRTSPGGLTSLAVTTETNIINQKLPEGRKQKLPKIDCGFCALKSERPTSE
jgi:hypothetical protein